MRRVVCSLATVLVAVTSPDVRAQTEKQSLSSDEPRWLVLPVLGGETAVANRALSSVEGLHTAAEALRQELVLRGQSVWRADRASERFEVVGSAPAPKVSQSDIDRWVERSRAAVRYLARADYKAARRELKAAQQLADRAADELNREAARAQQVLDTCLFMVRAYVETKNSAEARRQARECRRLVPRVEPTAFRHTPEVRELLTEVDQEMAAEAPGTLEVQSTPAGCLARINGVEFGRTPLSNIELPVGSPLARTDEAIVYRSNASPSGAVAFIGLGSKAASTCSRSTQPSIVRCERGQCFTCSIHRRRLGCSAWIMPARWCACSVARTSWQSARQ